MLKLSIVCKDAERDAQESWETDVPANTVRTQERSTIELVRDGLNGPLTLSGSLCFTDLHTYTRSESLINTRQDPTDSEAGG